MRAMGDHSASPLPSSDWAMRCEAEEWEAHVRDAAARRVHGLCVLDVAPKNILSYNQGAFRLVSTDLEAVLPREMAAGALDVCRAAALPAAFDLRRNLVNLKKVLLHSWHAAEPLERELRQLSTFWRVDMSFDKGFVDWPRYREVCVAHMRCKGATHAVFDGRAILKQICCIPRHPTLERPRKLSGLPLTLTVHSWLTQTRRLLADLRVPGYHDAKDAPARSEDESDGDRGVSNVQAELDAFMALAAERLPGWPDHALAYLRAVLIARGAAKALSIRSETAAFLTHLSRVAEDFAKAAAALRINSRRVEDVLVEDVGAVGGRFVTRESCSASSLDALSLAGKCDKYLNLLDGCVPVLENLATWVRRVVEDPSARVFVAGDSGAADFIPEGFDVGAIIASHRVAAEKWGRSMRRILDETEVWPPADRLMYMDGRQRCRHCDAAFSNLW